MSVRKPRRPQTRICGQEQGMHFHREKAKSETSETGTQPEAGTESGLGRSALAARVAKQLAERPTLPDENAYRLIEEARLRSLRRLDSCTGEDERRRWSSVHRELGMAGYLASGEIPPSKRVDLLARAKERSTEVSGDLVGDEYMVLKLITAAAAASLEALLLPVLAEHVQPATEHLAEARRDLIRALSEQRTRSASAA